LTAGIVFYPLTYIFDDIVTEVYGYKENRRLTWTIFAANILMWSGIYISICLPASPDWTMQSSFESVFQLSPRIFFASSIAFVIGDLFGSYILAKVKILTIGKHLWTRVITSGALGILIEGTFFCSFVFYGTLPTQAIKKMIFDQLLVKVAAELLLLPFTYLFTYFIKKAEDIDHFDYNTNFNPFSMSTTD
jgi:uncharacterized integral membrane protein (TIGR00697 family)